MKSVSCDTGKSSVIKNHYRVGLFGETAESEYAVVGLDDNVTDGLGIRKDGVGLDNLLREAVVEALEEERSETGTGTAGNRVEELKAL